MQSWFWWFLFHFIANNKGQLISEWIFCVFKSPNTFLCISVGLMGQGNYQNFDPSLLPINSKMADSKKLSFSKSPILKNFFVKISWIGPWVSRIDWCEGHWCGSTYMAMRLSNISSKTGSKCIFWLFLSFCWTASRPYTLSYIDALRIIQSY